MKPKREFAINSENVTCAPYHYTASGLDDIYLLNGFTVEDTAYGRAVAINNIVGLHHAIGLHIVQHKKALSGLEVKFFRREMNLTQQELANKLGINVQTVARYEKGEVEIPGPADRYIRVLYCLDLLPPDLRQEVIEAISESLAEDDTRYSEKVLFRSSDGEWNEDIRVNE